MFITPNSFGLLRAHAALGRVFLPGEANADAPRVVLLSHSLWRTRFGSDSSVVGTDIRVNGDLVTVVGVMPEGFGFPIAESFWLPLRLDLSQYQRGTGRLDVFGRLRPGVSPEDARAEFRTISNQLASTFPENRGIQAVARTFGQEYVGDDFTQRMLLMLAGACLVLVIACFNVANLLLARASSRTREIAVRTAVGATRSRIIAQLLTEVLILAAIGGALGLALAHGAVSWLAGVWTYVGAFDLPHGPDALFWWRLEMDAIPTLFAAITIVGAALLAGLAPAFQATAADVGVRSNWSSN